MTHAEASMPATRGELHATMNALRSEMKTLGDRLDAKIDRAQHSAAFGRSQKAISGRLSATTSADR